MRAKPIDGILVIVVPIYTVGIKGPVYQWGMPANAYGCGDLVGYRVCDYSVSKQEIVTFAWSFDTEQEAMEYARKRRARKRRLLAKFHKLTSSLEQGENE